MLGTRSRAGQIVALLHDVVEDSAIGLPELTTRGFDRPTLRAVDCLSRRAGETYTDYIGRVATDEIAREVKLLDIADNLANNRSLRATPDVLARIARYEEAFQTLTRAG
jgi:hypothetical protein